MVQAGILGNLKFDFVRNGWAVELGQALADLEYLSHSDPRPPNSSINRAQTRQNISQHLDMHNLVKPAPGYDCVSAIENGKTIPPLQLFAEIAKKVAEGDDSNRAFLRMGFAARLLEHAESSSRAKEYQKKAFNTIHVIQYECKEANVNVGAVSRLLAEPPLDERSIWDKIDRASQPLAVLFIAANPKDAEPLDTLGELATLRNAVKASVLPGSLRVESFPGGNLSELGEYLAQVKPVVLHFSGHGTERGFSFRNDKGDAAEVDPSDFARVLALYHEKGLRGVVMNACYTAEQAQVVADATGYVVAMDGKLSDSGAIAFTRHFYGSLGNGETFEKSFEHAVASVRLAPTMRGLNPKLFVRLRRSPTPSSASPSDIPRTQLQSLPEIGRAGNETEGGFGEQILRVEQISLPDTESTEEPGNILTGTVSSYSVAQQDAMTDLLGDRDIVLEAIKKNPYALQHASEAFRADARLMTEVVKLHGMLLQYGSPAVREDKEVVMAAVKQDPLALRYASADLQGDADIVMAAIKGNGYALSHASEVFRGNESLMTQAVKLAGILLQFGSPAVKGCREVVMAAVKQDAWSFRFASEDMRADKEIAMMVITLCPGAFRHASTILGEDVNFMMEVVKREGGLLEFASPTVQANRAVVLAAVRKCGSALRFASPGLRVDKEVAMEAVRQDPLAIRFARSPGPGERA